MKNYPTSTPLNRILLVITFAVLCLANLQSQAGDETHSGECNKNPKIHCPYNYNGCIGDSYHPSVTGYATADPGYHCSDPIVSYSDEIWHPSYCAGSKIIKRTWRADYPDPEYSHLYDECVQYIFLEDKEDPDLIYCPNDLIVDEWEGHSVYWNEPVFKDDCDNYLDIFSTHSSGDSFGPGSTKVVYYAKDDCGNTRYCSFYVTVKHSSLKVKCPDDIVIGCDGYGNYYDKWPVPEYETTCGQCGGDIDGFTYLGRYKGHDYYLSKYESLWPGASLTCDNLGGYLAVINDKYENHFLANSLNVHSAFIGLSDEIHEGKFKWVNGDNLAYQNWEYGQPNNYGGSQDYVEMKYDGYWNDEYNFSKHKFILELPCVTVTQIEGPTHHDQYNHNNYKITYKIKDLCGNIETCSFWVTHGQTIQLECPDDIVVKSKGYQTEVWWDEPKAETCCKYCPHGGDYIHGFQYLGKFKGHDYYISKDRVSWFDATVSSKQHGGYLAAINDKYENYFLTSKLYHSSAFIGLNDVYKEGHFVWSNGEPVTYTNWAYGQPNNLYYYQDFVELRYDGKWNDQDNNKKLWYIMEIEGCAEVKQVQGPPNGSHFPEGKTKIVYKAWDYCGNYTYCSFYVDVKQSYCSASGSYSKYSWIDKVVFGNNHNNSGDNGGYAYFSEPCLTAKPGNSYFLYLKPGFSGYHYNVYWKIYIDWNGDGDFYDFGEFVGYASGSRGQAGYIHIPYGASPGHTRMRIVMRQSYPPWDPCADFLKGEVEDYCLYIGTHDYNLDESTNKSLTNTEFQPVQLNEIKDFELYPESSSNDLENIGELNSLVKDQLLLYPNPASDLLFLSITGKEASSVIIKDNTGRLVRERHDALSLSETVRINVSDLKAGIYFLLVQYKNGDQDVKRFVVQN